MIKFFFITLSLIWAYYGGLYFNENYYLYKSEAGLIGDILEVIIGSIVIIFVGLFIAGIGYRISDYIEKR